MTTEKRARVHVSVRLDPELHRRATALLERQRADEAPHRRPLTLTDVLHQLIEVGLNHDNNKREETA